MCQMTDNKVYIRFKIIFIFLKNVLMCSLHPFYAVYFILFFFLQNPLSIGKGSLAEFCCASWRIYK